jgi:uncharacterized RDD family membrane protein YckC
MAEMATRMALEAQANAEMMLADLEAATEVGPHLVAEVERPRSVVAEVVAPRSVQVEEIAAVVEPERSNAPEVVQWEPEVVKTAAVKLPELPVQPAELIQRRPFGLRWEPDMPQRSPMQPHAPTAQRESIRVEDWWEPASSSQREEAIEPVEPETAIHANLIEFPRELVATRKIRPRLAEAGIESYGQLSIFEVDPGAISIEPEAVAAVPVGADWQRMELQPQMEAEVEEEPSQPAVVLHVASMDYRILAGVVDGSLILGAFVAAGVMAASRVAELPAMRVCEMWAAAGLLLTAAIYLTVFTALTEMTPGMRWAGVSLCTFDEQIPTRKQRSERLAALMLSLLPMGLGMVWSLFDEDRLSWHDRLSKTYLRKG